MSANPGDRKYRKTHEWFRADGDVVTVGITKYAADELTDITYVALPAVGTKVTADKSFGEIESVKATSDIYSALDGEIVETNAALSTQPELVNNDPFDQGWMCRIRARDLSQLNGLMDAAAYDEMVGGTA